MSCADARRRIDLLERAPAMLAYWDRDLVLRTANAAYAGWLGDTPEALVGRHATAVLGAPLFAQNEPHMRAALEGTAQHFERASTDAIGALRHVAVSYTPDLEDGTVVGFFVHVTDITHHKNDGDALRLANEELDRRVTERTAELQRINAELQREAEQRAEAELARLATAQSFRDLVEAAPDGLLVVSHEGAIVLANEQAHRMFGYAPGELVGAALERLVPASARAAHVNARHHFAAAGRPRKMAFGRDLDALRADGTVFPAAISLGPVNFRGAPATLAMVRDVTDRRALEASLRAAEERFLHAQKMDAIGRLASGIAHDFNNMLSVILSYASLALETLPADAPLREDLAEIRAAGDRAGEITRQLLTFSRPEPAAPKLVDLNACVVRMTKMLARAIGEHVHLEVELGEGVGFVRADPGHIEQVLLNLAVNARDAMPDGGSLHVRTHDVVVEPSYPGSRFGARPGPHVALVVRDTGAGMDETTRERIFEPFFTTKPAGKGTGLGLATVYSIVRQAGGTIDVDSAPGQGATFTVLLPQADDDTPSQRAEPGPASQRGREVVLLVEDEEPLRRVMTQVLTRLGYHVLAAADGIEALAAAAAFAGPIDVLLTDVVMPRMNGRRLADALAAERPGLQVVFMSGHTSDFVDLHDVDAIAPRLLQKPVTPESVAAVVRAAARAARR